VNTGAEFVRTIKSKVVVLDAPLPSVPVRVIVVVPPVVGVPEKERVAKSKAIPTGVADELIVSFEKSEKTFAGRVKFIAVPRIKVWFGIGFET